MDLWSVHIIRLYLSRSERATLAIVNEGGIIVASDKGCEPQRDRMIQKSDLGLAGCRIRIPAVADRGGRAFVWSDRWPFDEIPSQADWRSLG